MVCGWWFREACVGSRQHESSLQACIRMYVDVLCVSRDPGWTDSK